ncbi:MAG: pyridoxal phosphate-dependent aminotransferase [Nitrososphaerota archaeon]|nr:pyridoxal phosphate-dependent aminotransferase [Nitrososphaerota archaeon]MDG7013353.1 pyridoxal phosphate-dependent aminotransferase [Nitrososphaerota archaeon]MDG7025623.1 pyridoxal phosphate-dependent aminotransferase [Nitrososphaerota archaeon]
MAAAEDPVDDAGGPINMWVADPYFRTDERIIEAFNYAVANGCTHYFPAPGFDGHVLQKAIARYYLEDLAVEVDPLGEVCPTHGAQEALSLAVQAGTRPGDEIVVPEPTYSAFIEKLETFGVRPVFVPLAEEEHWRLDVDAVKSAMSEKTKMIYICNPNNPTGTTCSRGELDAVSELLKEHERVSLLLDECYARILYDGSTHHTLLGDRGLLDRLYVVDSFSKTYAMTGWRLGYLVTGKRNADRVKRLSEEYNGGVSYAVQYAGAAALARCSESVRSMVAELDRRRLAMVDALAEVKDVSFETPSAGFEVFVDVSAYSMDSVRLASELEKIAGVKTMPGVKYGPSGEGHLRLVFCAEDVRRVREGVSRIDGYLQGNRG